MRDRLTKLDLEQMMEQLLQEDEGTVEIIRSDLGDIIDQALAFHSLRQEVKTLAEWHDTKAFKAATYREQPDPVMDKAAVVHDASAYALRRLLDFFKEV